MSTKLIEDGRLVREPIVDRVIGYFSPASGLKRFQERQAKRIGQRFSLATGIGTRLDRGSGAQSSRRTYSDDTQNRALGLTRRRAQELDATNTIASGMLDRCTDNEIGSGITPQARSKDEGWNREAETLFNDWWMTRADARGLLDGPGLQELWSRTNKRDGDVGIVLVRDGTLQTIEADDIVTPPAKSGDPTVVDGIQLNRIGKPVSFWVAERNLPEADTYIEVPAADFIYYPNIRGAKQTRGEPAFSRGTHLFDMIDGNIEAVIAASQMAAMFGLLIRETGGSTLNSLPVTKDASGVASRQFNMEPAMIRYLRAGDEVTQVTPQQPTTNFPEFISLVIRLLALPVGLPLELAFLDFSKTNYSSARAALLQAYRRFRRFQNRLINVVLGRIWRWKISSFIKNGKLPDRDDAWDHKWIAEGWQWVDPVKEFVAAFGAVDAGFSTLQEQGMLLGVDWRESLLQRQRELSLQRELGIPIVHSALTRDPDQKAAADSSRDGSSDRED